MSDNKHLTPVCIIYVDGIRLDTAHEGAVQSVTITDSLNDISEFTIVFNQSEIEISEAGFISFESQISIHLGYKDDVEEVFLGEVTGFKLTSSTGSQCTVCGYNVFHKLNHCRRFNSFENKTPSLVSKDLIESYSLQADLDDFGANYDFSQRADMSDYEYLLYCAMIFGKQLFTDGKIIYLKNEITVRNDEIIYEQGKSLISVESSHDIVNIISAVRFIGWDKLNNQALAGEASLADIPVKVGGGRDWTQVSNGGNGMFVETCVNNDIKDIDSAKQLAIGHLQTNSFEFGTAQGLGEGNYKLRPGMRVTLKMTGTLSDGEYIADVVTHNFDCKSGYTTGFKLKRNMCP